MTPYEEFTELSHQIGLVNLHLPDGLERPIHRVNDAALIIFHVFALEDFCLNYVSRTTVKKARHHGIRSRILGGLAEAVNRPDQLDAIRPLLKAVDEVIMIRDLYAHRLGRRRDLDVAACLTPTILRDHGFEADDADDDLSARWWPKRCVAFAACVGPLKQLAKWVDEHMARKP